MSNPQGAPGLGVAIAALLVLGCGEEPEPTGPASLPAPPIASVVLDRDTATVAVGGTVQLAVTIKDAQGSALTGRAVTWSSTTAARASVSNSGLVTGLQVGQSRIVATAEGKSDTATVFVPPASVAIILEQTGARTVTLGPAGGSIQTIDADGVRYTLVVPPLALMLPVAITMTPLLSVTGLPLSGGFVAGADFAPSGLVFAKPATLTISTSGQAGQNQRLVGLSYKGSGSGIGLTAAEATPNAVTFALNHFSGVIAGFGTTQDIEALYLSLPSLPGIGTPAIDLLVGQANSPPRDGAVELFLMEGWFDFIILPGLGAVTTDAQLVQAMGEYEMWRRFVPDLLDIYLFVPGGENAPSLVTRRNQWDQAFTTKVTLAIARNKQLCAAPGLASARVAALDNALFWSRVVRSGVGMAPTPQNGLDLASFRAGLCAQAVIQNVVLADPLQEGVAHSLDATFAIRFADGVTVPSDFVVTTSSQGADLQVPAATAASPPGHFTGTVTPTSSGTVTLDLRGCYAGGQFLLFVLSADEICQTSQLIRDVTSPFAIVSSTLPGGTVGVSYSQSLQASGGTGSYAWSLVAGQLPPGLGLAPGGVISGTPTAAGSFNFTVQVVSGTLSAQRALSISVGQASAALVWHFDSDLEGWSCSSSTDCKWQLLSSQQFPQTSGWVALQDIGEAVSRNIALPSNARFLRFDASTHNVPGDVSRVAVQVLGVTVLDTVFTNPGSNTAFNFVTMTVDISARAGQTVNIRFVQLDDGQGSPKTLKIDNISISPN